MEEGSKETDRIIKVVSVKDWQRLLELIEDFSKFGILIQAIPCGLVVSSTVLDLVLDLTLELMNSGRNIAKKPYMEFLLRLFARTQIKDVVSILRDLPVSICWLVIHSRSSNAQEVYNKLMMDQIIGEAAFSSCEVGIDKIIEIYGLDRAQLISQAEFRGEPLENVLLKAVLEKISTSLVSK